ncbi:MAG: PBP1A family penicillin-binding protein [Polyangiaceae bacterium]
MSERDDGIGPEPKETPPRPKKKRRRRQSWWRRWLPRIGVVLLGLLVAGALGLVLVLRHYEADLPAVGELRHYNPPQVTRVLARDGSTLGEMFVERRTVVAIDAVPDVMKKAVLAAEDARFYEHTGLNYLGMLRALAHNVTTPGSLQGGSTITQQVVKNVLLTPERTFSRKAKEVILARRIEQTLSKDEILELYLNHIYFGHGRYGVEEASRFYFGKSVSELKLAEAAMLAGIVKGPSIYSPRVSRARALARRRFVLDQMAQKGFAPGADVDAALEEPIVLAPESDVSSDLAPEAVEEVRKLLGELVGPAGERGGYTITTTIDPALQAAARAAVRKNLDDYAVRHKLVAPLKKAKGDPKPSETLPKTSYQTVLAEVIAADDAKGTLTVRAGKVEATVDLRDAGRYNPKKLKASEIAEIGKTVRVTLHGLPEPGEADDSGQQPGRAPAKPHPVHAQLELGPQGALVAVDVKTREILALVGSYEGARGGLDRATRASRQPGSTFKPFTYGYGIHTRTMTPASLLVTDPTEVSGYKPGLLAADEGAARKPKRMREALAKSINVAAVWSIDRLGPKNVAKWAASHGITSKLGSDLSLALGSYEVTPREMVAAYATWAAGGEYQAPVLVTKIVGPNGVEVKLPEREAPRRVMDEAEAYLVTSLLTSVVEEGTGQRAKSLGRPIAGKTGTSNRAKDAWFVGFSADVACAVWTGFDDGTPLGAGESGAAAALPAFVEAMRAAHKDRPVTPFREPPGIVRRSIDPETGLLAYEGEEKTIEEVFLAGTDPVETAVPDAGADALDTLDEDAGAPIAAGDEPTEPERDPDAGATVLLPARGPGATEAPDAGAALLPARGPGATEAPDAGAAPLPAPVLPVRSTGGDRQQEAPPF